MRAFIGIFAVYALAFASCKGNDPDDPSGSSFDKEAMLRQIADEVVLPSLSNFQSSVTAFEASVETWSVVQSESNLIAMRSAFDVMYVDWQQCAPIAWGPAAEHQSNLVINTFPADTTRIRTLLSLASYDLMESANIQAKGLPALDYLLYSANLTQWSTEVITSYLQANVALIKDESAYVLGEWQATYRDQFIQSTGSDVGSALGMMVNAINQDFELVKNAKVGIPLGKKTLGVAQPEKVEAPYAQYSTRLIHDNLNAILDIFTGADGLGIDDLLDSLNAQYGQVLLSDAIEQGFGDVISQLNDLNPDLASEIHTNPERVEALYSSLQNLVVLLKTDMPSRLGVQITYQDNDGD
jgi:predicted lipoprotein